MYPTRLLPVSLFAAVLLILSACSQPPRQPLGPSLVSGETLQHENLSEYRQALQQASASGKAVMVIFSAPEWCGSCKVLEEKVIQSRTFKDYRDKRLVLLQYTVPRGQPETPGEEKVIFLADAMGADGVPTILVVNPQGREVVRRSYGGAEAKAFVGLIEKRIQVTGALEN